MPESKKSLIINILRDSLVAALILFGVNRPIFSAEKWEATDLIIGVAVLLASTLFFRRRFPVTVLVVSVLLSILLMFSGVSGPVVGLAPALSIFSTSRSLTTRVFLATSSLTIFVLVGTFLFFAPFDLTDPALFAFAALQIIAVATGLAAKSRRENLKLLELRAQQAEESKESEARTRVGAERLRIARDLHDLIGHQLAASALHAELAERLVRNDPDSALESLGAIKQSARQSLGELAQMLRVLRDDDKFEALASMENVSSLIESHRNYGLEVIGQFDEGLSSLEASTQLVVYRCLQEALTNAGKYADPKEVKVAIISQAGELRIHITNEFNPASHKPLSGGYGLVGLRERVETVGGLVEVSDSDGFFELDIAIPLEDEA